MVLVDVRIGSPLLNGGTSLTTDEFRRPSVPMCLRLVQHARSETKGGAMTRYKVGYLIGSLSSTSINRKLAKALIRLAPEGLEFAEIPSRDLPLYTPDYDADFPPVALEF